MTQNAYTLLASTQRGEGLHFFPTAGQPQSAANTVTLSDSNIVKLRIGKMDKYFLEIHPNTIRIYLCSANSRLGY